MVVKERRSFVREDFYFQVRFRKVPKEEYERVRKTSNPKGSLHKKKLIINVADTDNKNSNLDVSLINFLLQINEKLDRMIAMLSRDEVEQVGLAQGTGVNISGSGMNLVVDKLVEAEQIIHANFLLSKFPLFDVDVFGKVIRVTPIIEDGKTAYQLGIKFLDIDPDDREKIIAWVFQKQREAIRSRKGESCNLEDS
jgi:hypothetical protein